MKKWTPILVGLTVLILNGCSAISPPEVVGISPSDGSVVMDTNFTVNVKFSKPMNRQKTEQAFVIYNSIDKSSSMEGVFSWQDDFSFTFKPFADKVRFPAQYSVVIDSLVEDKDGNNMKQKAFIHFNLMEASMQPFLVNTFPLNGETNFSIQSSITLQFSQPMDESATRGAFSISPSIDGMTHVESNLLVFKPSAYFINATYYTISLSVEAKGTNQCPVKSPYSICFIAGQDFIIPVVTGVYTNLSSPALGNPEHYLDKSLSNLTFQFNTEMDRNSFVSSFSINPSANCYFNWTGSNTVDVLFQQALLPAASYTIKLSSSLKSLTGRESGTDYFYQFYTDGSTLPNFGSAFFNGTPWDTNIINIFNSTTNGTNINSMGIQVDFNGSAGMDLLSLYSKAKVEYLQIGQFPAFSGNIQNILDLSGNSYLFILGNVNVSNMYKLTLPGGTGGIEDVNHNHLEETIEIYFYSTN